METVHLGGVGSLRSGRLAAVSGERSYAAILLASLADPSAQVARWLAAPDGPPPVDLLLMASMFERVAARLADLVGPDGVWHADADA